MRPTPPRSRVSRFLTLIIATIGFAGPVARAADGIWSNATGGGLWSDAANWSGGTIADGSGTTANFNTLDLLADITAHLDASRTLGALVFGDTATATAGGWLLDDNASGGANVLTLDGTTPAITVNAMASGKGATISAAIAGVAGLTKSGAGSLTLSGANIYGGGTTVNGGTLKILGANLPSPGTLTVGGTGATLDLADGTIWPQAVGGLTLTTGARLKLDWTTAPAADSITTAAAATTSGMIVLIPTGNFTTGNEYTFLHADGGGLNGATYLLSNNVNYVATCAVSATDVKLTPTAATALTAAYWFGGKLTGAAGVMAFSDGTQSNWSTSATSYVSTAGLVPGSAANIHFDDYTGVSQLTTLALGSDLTVAGLTFDNAATSGKVVTITADGHALTIGSSGISNGQSRPWNITVNADVIVAATQTWSGANNNNSLIVNGVISGSYAITMSGTNSNKLVLGAANTFSGGLTTTKGSLILKNRNALQNSTLTMNGGTGGLVFDSSVTEKAFNLGGLIATASGSGYNIALQNNATTPAAIALSVGSNGANTTYAGVLSGAGGLTKIGAGKLTLTGSNLHTGATTVAAGTLALGSAGSISSSSGVELAAGATLDTTAQTSYAMPAGKSSIFHLGGAGASGRIKAAGLDITNAAVTFVTDTTLYGAVYILADYASLAGGAFASVTTVPSGYDINYQYNGGTQIALVSLTGVGYSAWANSFTNPPLSDSAPDADPDHDGLSNALEYVLGSDPRYSNPAGLGTSVSGGNLILSFPRAVSSETGDISLQVEVSTDLSDWTSHAGYVIGATTATSSAGVTVTQNGTNPDTITVTIPRNGEVTKYARLKVTVNN